MDQDIIDSLEGDIDSLALSIMRMMQPSSEEEQAPLGYDPTKQQPVQDYRGCTIVNPWKEHYAESIFVDGISPKREKSIRDIVLPSLDQIDSETTENQLHNIGRTISHRLDKILPFLGRAYDGENQITRFEEMMMKFAYIGDFIEIGDDGRKNKTKLLSDLDQKDLLSCLGQSLAITVALGLT